MVNVCIIFLPFYCLLYTYNFFHIGFLFYFFLLILFFFFLNQGGNVVWVKSQNESAEVRYRSSWMVNSYIVCLLFSLFFFFFKICFLKSRYRVAMWFEQRSIMSKQNLETDQVKWLISIYIFFFTFSSFFYFFS